MNNYGASVTLNEKVLIAVIAGVSALLGSLIPQVFTYFSSRSQRIAEQVSAQQRQQSIVYEELLLSLQRTMNEGNSGFQSFQEAILKISLYGDAKTAKKATAYYQTLVHRGHELKAAEHADFQKSILNSMRAQLSLPEVNNFEIVRFTPPK